MLHASVNGNSIQNKTLNESTLLNPRYKVKYTHKFNNSDGDRSDGQTRERSGNPGYNVGRPIWSGTSVINETSGKPLYVNQHETQQIGIWDPSPSGLCSMSGKRKVAFGEDLFSSCVVPLTLDSLNDCQKLREWLLFQLSRLMPSDRIGRYGNNNANRSSDWIQVIRENLSDRYPDIVPIPELNATNITMNNSSSGSTSGIALALTTEPTTQATNQSQFSNGTCTQVPAGIVLDIMYAKTGLAHGTQIKEIIGAKVSYVFDNWHFTCDVNGGSCVFPSGVVNNTDPEVYQLFTLTAVVHFMEVPEARPNSVTRYEEMTASHEYWYDVCLSDILFPIMRQPKEEATQFMKRLAVTFIIIFIAILYGTVLQIT